MYSRLALLCLLLTAGALAQQAAPAEGPTSIPSLAPLLAPASAPAGAAVAALASFPSLAVPSSAPPTETPVEAPAPTASDCVARVASLANSCATFQSALAGADPSSLSSLSDAQLQQVVAGQPAPSAECCTAATSFIMGDCRCDPTVQQLTAAQGFTPATLSTVNRASILACMLPITDTASC